MDNSLPQPERSSPTDPVWHIPQNNLPHQTTQSPQIPPDSIKVTHIEEKPKEKDPPLVDLKITNPVTYLKNWLGKLLKNQDIDIRIKIKPFATLALIAAFSATFGVGYNLGIKSAAKVLFPNSSPILHREVDYEGVIQKSNSGQYYLKLSNGSLWSLKDPLNEINFESLVNQKVILKGNLTSQKDLIEVKEVLPQVISAQIASPTPSPQPLISASLPKLYSKIQWETTQKKVLIFTSGKRKIEQEGVYLESGSLSYLPQDFLDYYNYNLQNSGFKQTLNSTNPDGTVVTYSKDDTFLTFGVKNIFQGQGDNKILKGYKAFIEHN